MKKTILSVAVLMASFVGFNSFAQSPEEVVEVTEAVEAVASETPAQVAKPMKKGKFDRRAIKKDARQMRPAKAENRGQKRNIFEGLNLTEEQKSALKEICPQSQCTSQNAQCDSAATTCAAPASDSKAKGKAKPQRRPEGLSPEQRQAKKAEFLSKVKGILTPEQYVQFLENNFSIGQPRR